MGALFPGLASSICIDCSAWLTRGWLAQHCPQIRGDRIQVRAEARRPPEGRRTAVLGTLARAALQGFTFPFQGFLHLLERKNQETFKRSLQRLLGEHPGVPPHLTI